MFHLCISQKPHQTHICIHLLERQSSTPTCGTQWDPPLTELLDHGKYITPTCGTQWDPPLTELLDHGKYPSQHQNLQKHNILYLI